MSPAWPTRKSNQLFGTLFVLLAFASALGFWHFKVEPALLWKRALYQLKDIELGVMRFNGTHTNQPESIGEIVRAKHLPERSSIYASALKNQKQIPEPIAYSDSDYEIFVEGDEVVIRVKPSVYQQITQVSRLRGINSNVLRLHKSGRIFTPGSMQQK